MNEWSGREAVGQRSLFLHRAERRVSAVQLHIQINERQTAWTSWSIERGMGGREKQSKRGAVGLGGLAREDEKQEVEFAGMIPSDPSVQRLCVFPQPSVCVSICVPGLWGVAQRQQS